MTVSLPRFTDWPSGTLGIPKSSDIDIRPRTDAEVSPFFTPWRSAIVNKITDGDTQDFRVDVGFGVNGPEVELRLLGFRCGIEDERIGVDAFETTLRKRQTVEMKARGLAAKRFCEMVMPVGSRVLVLSRKAEKDSLSRWLAVILYRYGPSWGWHSLGDELLARKMATVWWPRKTSGARRPT